LRFNNRAWKNYKINDVCSVYDGTHQTPDYKKQGIKFVSVENIKNLYQTDKFVSEKDFKINYKIYPQYGDILMTRIGDIGTPAIVNKEESLAYYVSLALLKPNHNKIISKFLYSYIETTYFKEELWHRTIHVAFPIKINKEEIGKCSIKIPNIVIQQKIVNLLSLIDERIETQNKIIEDLKTQRIWIKNNYFRHLKNVKEYPFEKLFSEYKEFNTNGLPQFTIGKNGIKNINNSDVNYPTNRHIIFYSSSLILGIGIEEIGISLQEYGCCSPIYKTYKINTSLLNPEFSYYFIKNYFHNYKRFITQKSTRREFEFDYKQVIKIIFKIPLISEQIHISNLLNWFSKQLEIEKNILELYKKQKQFLLNNMFI